MTLAHCSGNNGLAKMAAMFVWSVLYGHCDKTKQSYNELKIREREFAACSQITLSYNYVGFSFILNFYMHVQTCVRVSHCLCGRFVLIKVLL